MSGISKAGIETTPDGASYIPSSRRADGSTRKEIRVRPGYRPPEDVEKYKNRNAEAWKNRGEGAVPGAESPAARTKDEGPTKTKNAKRREAARRKAGTGADTTTEASLAAALETSSLTEVERRTQDWNDPTKLATAHQTPAIDQESDEQKKIRNQLKKLKAVRELKNRKTAGEKLSHDQLLKIGKENEILRDLKKLGYDEAGSQLKEEESNAPA